MPTSPPTALVLSGGGARAAYQVGVLQAIAQMRREALGPKEARSNPFDIIVGTSAGAINSAALACHADRFDTAIEQLVAVWSEFQADRVYRADALGVIRSGAQWLTMLSLGWALARWRRFRPRSLLDNGPLETLLHELIPMQRLPQMLARRHLRALAVTAFSYSTGEHVTFYSAAQALRPWVRSQRMAAPTQLGHEHLLASAAIPFVFPAHSIMHEGQAGWYGDGSMRQSAPLSPAIHLGAERMLVIGAGRMHEPPAPRASDRRYPSLAQIAGHALSSIFLDALAVDVERLARINRTLSLLPPAALSQTPLRPVECLVIAPSQRLDDIAARHVDALPAPVRTLLHGVGVGRAGGPQTQGSALASYLLFEAPFTRELMALGAADARARQAEVAQFFGWPRATGDTASGAVQASAA
ncbi:patatin-like phospholipase family protein [Curvibacter sp. HBC61]|uniref:Patatin-like phospholipase family protein n=1 Tax=Curvibacter cyanobacteriorum TaxID=3026422 RepID=A0ABT5MU91_9BURK|nr:patatin-like phospholipase family protein [Curvibacter sp. HBC61]MDD0837612.1 patatin-like phospholipase family protein [Curvibacter sp. HBC61]